MAPPELIPRLSMQRLDAARRISRVVLLEGPRASGKSTALRMLQSAGTLDDIVDMTDDETMDSARSDPQGFIEALAPPVALDEVQLVPSLVLAIKRMIDRWPTWGPIILTGSSPVARGQLGGSDPLVGRAVRLGIRPLSRREIGGRPDTILDQLADPAVRSFKHEQLDRDRYVELAMTSGFPDALGLDVSDGSRWFGTSYAAGVLPRALDDENRRVNPQTLRLVLRSLAGSPAAELNVSELARRLDATRETISNHVALLADLGLIDPLPGWRRGASKRHVARPKIHPADGGMSAWSIGSDPTDAELGGLVESMVYRELAAQVDHTFGEYELHHWRTQRHEVDLLLVARDRFIPIEVKLSRSVPRQATRGIDAFADEFPDRFLRGIVFYAGDAVVPLGRDRLAVPISALWTTPAREGPTA